MRICPGGHTTKEVGHFLCMTATSLKNIGLRWMEGTDLSDGCNGETGGVMFEIESGHSGNPFSYLSEDMSYYSIMHTVLTTSLTRILGDGYQCYCFYCWHY